VAVGVDLDRGLRRGSDWYGVVCVVHGNCTTAPRLIRVVLVIVLLLATEPKFPHSFILIGPLKQYILRFASLQDKHTWMSSFNGAIKKVINEDIAPDENRRFGIYRFPKEEGYVRTQVFLWCVGALVRWLTTLCTHPVQRVQWLVASW
jgi:hypothetical protein